jgi:hypothetical protein
MKTVDFLYIHLYTPIIHKVYLIINQLFILYNKTNSSSKCLFKKLQKLKYLASTEIHQ